MHDIQTPAHRHQMQGLAHRSRHLPSRGCCLRAPEPPLPLQAVGVRRLVGSNIPSLQTTFHTQSKRRCRKTSPTWRSRCTRQLVCLSRHLGQQHCRSAQTPGLPSCSRSERFLLGFGSGTERAECDDDAKGIQPTPRRRGLHPARVVEKIGPLASTTRWQIVVSRRQIANARRAWRNVR